LPLLFGDGSKFDLLFGSLIRRRPGPPEDRRHHQPRAWCAAHPKLGGWILKKANRRLFTNTGRHGLNSPDAPTSPHNPTSRFERLTAADRLW
jgi:hypothetical protein